MSIRKIVIYASLLVIGASFCAFLSGPLWGLRLDYEKGQQFQLLQIIIPTFLSYLSMAVVYATYGKPTPEPKGERGQILRIVSIGAIAIFVLGLIGSTILYYVSANGTLQYGRLDFERYSTLITTLLGILNATTSAVTAFLFPGAKQ